MHHNKIDTVPKENLLAVIAAYAAAHDFKAVIPISAQQGNGWTSSWPR
jgi:GTP-binding protein Era